MNIVKIMSKLFILFFLLIIFTINIFAQSGRVDMNKPTVADGIEDVTVEKTAKELYAEASLYALNKIAEFEKKRVPYSDALRNRTFQEQKQLAAKYAAVVAKRENLSADDVYYLAMLDWTAENFDNTTEIFDKYLALPDKTAEKAQTARSVLVIINARRKDFYNAERFVAEYLKNEPVNARERLKFESELTEVYYAEKKFDAASSHGEIAFRLARETFASLASRPRGLNDLIETGMRLFEIYRDSDNSGLADKTLADLRRQAIVTGSNGIYYTAVDEQIKYLIETKRKPAAIKLYQDAFKQLEKDLPSVNARADVIQRLKQREAQYKLLGETAPELVGIDRWIASAPQTLATMRGKVVLLDFWATWCVPCIESFPSLMRWQKNYAADGLQIVGVTRYYGEADGEKANKTAEFAHIEKFKKEQNLPYDIAVGNTIANQLIYGANSIPTVVLIDRHGIVRYAATGNQEEKTREMIERLLAEE